MPLPDRLGRLLALAEKPERLIVGLMSGTSMDGLDLALCRVRGHGTATAVELLQWHTESYSINERSRLLALVSQEQVVLRDLCVLNAWLAARHAEIVGTCLERWGVRRSEVDCLASHGQTVYHAPASWEEHGASRHATLQMGDGDLLAVRTGIVTVSDFRQKEIAGGGEGAPLAPYAEALLFAAPVPRILLNLGGVANFTWLPPQGAGVLPVFGDIGPGNALIDRAVRHFFPERKEGYDRNGRIAASGRVNVDLLGMLKAHPYYERSYPKSTGPEMFGDDYLAEIVEWADRYGLPGEDVVATLTRLTVETVAGNLARELPRLAGTELYGSGGGWNNPAIRRGLREALPEPSFHDAGELGIPPDAKEAVLFAVLANETLAGDGFAPLLRGGEERRFGFGKISLPD